MPTYEYKCDECGHEFEIRQDITAKPAIFCPNCRLCSLRRIISGGTGFILKGGGWYKDGYASKKEE
jgi:putative FmdB family regulatory protein